MIYNTFDSNEAMETKVKQGGTRYDLIFPSESMIPKMIDEQLLIPLEHDKLVGSEDLSDFLMDQRFDKTIITPFLIFGELLESWLIVTKSILPPFMAGQIYGARNLPTIF